MNTPGEPSSNHEADVVESSQKLTIFINYRREDTGGQARLFSERLKEVFGEDNVYFDVDQQSGIDWLAQIEARGLGAGAFLALIGHGWQGCLKARSAAALNEGVKDFVRSEIEWALRDWSGVVIPVLFDTQMPRAETLPRSIRGLCRRQAAELRHASFERDLEHLVERLRQVCRTTPAPVLDGEPEPAPPPARELRAAAGVPEPTADHYAEVIEGMLEGTVVPLLGPSVRGSLPDAAYLAARLAEQFDVQSRSPDLAEIAQYVAVTKGERRLYAAINETLAAASRPMPVHRFLAEFPRLLRRRGLPPRPQLIISTNYDWALERAFEDANEPFDYALYLAGGGRFVHMPWDEQAAEPVATTIEEPKTYTGFPMDIEDGQLERTVIVKINGAADGEEGPLRWRHNYVVTEDHYIDYLSPQTIHDHLPIQILEKLTGSSCLFLGYTLRDWNARVLLRRIWQGKALTERSWSVSHDPDVLEKASWSVIGHVELLAASSTEYATALRGALLDLHGERPPSQRTTF